MHPSEPFPHFVDDYLAYLYEVLPSQASLDGVHLHDDLLEDFGRPAIEAHTRALAGFGRRLQQIDPAPLPNAEKVEHAIVASNIDARMHELETVRTWERNPQLYADALGTSLASQALFAYAPEAGARPAHCLEAAAGAAARPGGARQHPRLPRHLRQDRPRDVARRR